jgi:predicted ATP-dependent endonuclease of OLD family
MKLTQLRISNFQCFGEEPTIISLEPMTFLLGPNGAGKTAVLQALSRLFGFERSTRDVKRTDFHTSSTTADTGDSDSLALWIEGQFEFPELKKPNGNMRRCPATSPICNWPPQTAFHGYAFDCRQNLMKTVTSKRRCRTSWRLMKRTSP